MHPDIPGYEQFWRRRLSEIARALEIGEPTWPEDTRLEQSLCEEARRHEGATFARSATWISPSAYKGA